MRMKNLARKAAASPYWAAMHAARSGTALPAARVGEDYRVPAPFRADVLRATDGEDFDLARGRSQWATRRGAASASAAGLVAIQSMSQHRDWPSAMGSRREDA